MTPVEILVLILTGGIGAAMVNAILTRRSRQADVADKISAAWDRHSEEQRSFFDERAEALLKQVSELTERIHLLEEANRQKDRLYMELGQRLQSEIRLRLQNESTIDRMRHTQEQHEIVENELRRENEILRVRVQALEKKIGELENGIHRQGN